jgi:Rod binding domain-containing protein
MQAVSGFGMTPPTIGPTALDLASNPKATPKDAAKAFESMFASIMLKSMRQASGQGMFAHDPGDVLGGLFDHFMSQHLAQHGSLGVGAVIEKHLESRNKHEAAKK